MLTEVCPGVTPHSAATFKRSQRVWDDSGDCILLLFDAFILKHAAHFASTDMSFLLWVTPIFSLNASEVLLVSTADTLKEWKGYDLGSVARLTETKYSFVKINSEIKDKLTVLCFINLCVYLKYGNCGIVYARKPLLLLIWGLDSRWQSYLRQKKNMSVFSLLHGNLKITCSSYQVKLFKQPTKAELVISVL